MAIKKEPTKPLTIRFPVSLVEQIDQICAANYINRSSWLIKAAKQLLDKDRTESTEEILARITLKEEDVDKK